MPDDRFEKSRISTLLKMNQDKPFVQRILKKDQYPVLKNEDGSVSTHSMAWGEADGKAFVYPTVVQGEDGNLRRLGRQEAWQRAMETGDAIKFDNPKEANWFSRNYKKVWDNHPNGGRQ